MTENQTGGVEYTERLGILQPDQFQAALQRHALGDFLSAEPITGGFGQCVFLNSTKGRYVLRGCPHCDWQFPKEQFLSNLLHEFTQAPVAWPYLYDPSSDIFGWSYLLMPRMPGRHDLGDDLSTEDKLGIMRALGHNLALMQELTWSYSGKYDLASGTIQPFEGGLAEEMKADVRSSLSRSRERSPLTRDSDFVWVEERLKASDAALNAPFQPCFVMNDYGLNNVGVEKTDEGWRVVGLYDLMEPYFGYGQADVIRVIMHFDLDLACEFLRAYWGPKPPLPGYVEWLELFLLRDRLIFWEFGTTPGRDWFGPDSTVQNYCEPQMAKLHRILEGV